MSRRVLYSEIVHAASAPGVVLPRLVLLTPSLGLGGAERWVLSVAKHIVGWSVTIGCQWGGGLAQEATKVARLLIEDRDGVQLIREACEAADVVLAWGFVGRFDEFVGRARCVVGVSHAMPWKGDQLHDPAHYISRYCHHISAVCGPAAKAWPEGRTVKVIENGIELDRIAPVRGGSAWRADLGIPDSARVILVLGRLAWEKRPEMALAAFRLLPPGFHLVFAGADFHNQRHKFAGPRVHFTESPHVGDALDGADVMLLPSVVEAMPLAVLEAMAAGVPVVCTAWPVIHEMEARHGQIVRSVPDGPDFPARAAAAIQAAVLCPDTEPARRVAWRHYSAARMARRWSDYLLSLI